MNRRAFLEFFTGKGRRQARIGVAILRQEDCLAWGGSDCQMCFARCPLMGEAITLEDFKPFIWEDRCTGCGVCEHVCATVNDRNAVTVVALGERERAEASA